MTLEEQIKALTLRFVEERQGCKATELATAISIEIYRVKAGFPDLPYLMMKIWDEMVKSGELIQVEYLLPQMPDRVKTLFYLPHGTIILGVTNLNENLQTQNVDEWIEGGKGDKRS